MITRITNTAELKPLAATLHDARFTADTIAYDVAARTFTLTCWVFEPASRRWQAWQLSLNNVTDCRVNLREKVCYYELATIRFSERDCKLDLITHYGIEISLTVCKLAGALTNRGETRDNWEDPK